jgi:hypothetical protein
MNRRTPEELEQLAKDVITLNTPDSETPRTDEEFAKTLTPEEEYEGAEREAWAEAEAWEWARKLEKEVAYWRRRCKIVEETFIIASRRPRPFSELF